MPCTTASSGMKLCEEVIICRVLADTQGTDCAGGQPAGKSARDPLPLTRLRCASPEHQGHGGPLARGCSQGAPQGPRAQLCQRGRLVAACALCPEDAMAAAWLSTQSLTRRGPGSWAVTH